MAIALSWLAMTREAIARTPPSPQNVAALLHVFVAIDFAARVPFIKRVEPWRQASAAPMVPINAAAYRHHDCPNDQAGDHERPDEVKRPEPAKTKAIAMPHH